MRHTDRQTDKYRKILHYRLWDVL